MFGSMAATHVLLSTIPSGQVEEEPDGEPMPCHCGARACTGRMN